MFKTAWMKSFMTMLAALSLLQGCSTLSSIGTIALDTLECAAGVDCVTKDKEKSMTYSEREAARRQAEAFSQSLTNATYLGDTTISSPSQSYGAKSVTPCSVRKYDDNGKLRCGCGGACAR